MAKMTIKDVTYEGTPEELREIVRSFEESVVDAPATPKTEKRHAKVGERILITRKVDSDMRDMTVGKTYEVVEDGYFGDYVEVIDDAGDQASAMDSGYEVIVEDTAPANDKPATEIEHNGAKYTLVDRKAQPGDVVYVTKEAESTSAIPNEAYYDVGADGKINANTFGRFDVYPRLYDRTPENVLVYAPKEQPKPKTGDIVVITANTNNSRNKVGDIGKVGEAHWDGEGARVNVVGGPKIANWTLYTEMRLATPAEVAEYHKAADIAKLKAGDYITIDVLKHADDITAGKAYEVREDSDGDLYFRDDDGWPRYTPISDGAFAKADAKDVVFTKLGRKTGEFKKGDIVRFTPYREHRIHGLTEYPGIITEIEEIGGSAYYLQKPAFVTNDIGTYTLAEELELIAPVESRVDVDAA